jgi:hypothetical protein
VGDFESLSAVHDFLEHPTHAEVVRRWAGLARTVVADLEL